MLDRFGKYSIQQAVNKLNYKSQKDIFRNNVTRRQLNLIETTPSRSPSTSLESANIKSLRVYRIICRLLPYILKVHEMLQHRVNHYQSKIFVANLFRKNSRLTDLASIDRLVDSAYQALHNAEWHISHTGYLYRYLTSPRGDILNDRGIDRFDDYRAQKAHRKSGPTSFLKSFYRGHKSHEL